MHELQNPQSELQESHDEREILQLLGSFCTTPGSGNLNKRGVVLYCTFPVWKLRKGEKKQKPQFHQKSQTKKTKFYAHKIRQLLGMI